MDEIVHFEHQEHEVCNVMLGHYLRLNVMFAKSRHCLSAVSYDFGQPEGF